MCIKGVAVAKDVRVDPADLRMSSDHMDMHHADLSAAHSAANSEIESAQAGWVGASGAVLAAVFAEWQAATAAITSEIANHGAAFQSAAERYAAVDDASADSLKRTAVNVADAG
jgi:WXG100 family type VII secretion target